MITRLSLQFTLLWGVLPEGGTRQSGPEPGVEGSRSLGPPSTAHSAIRNPGTGSCDGTRRSLRKQRLLGSQARTSAQKWDTKNKRAGPQKGRRTLCRPEPCRAAGVERTAHWWASELRGTMLPGGSFPQALWDCTLRFRS